MVDHDVEHMMIVGAVLAGAVLAWLWMRARLLASAATYQATSEAERSRMTLQLAEREEEQRQLGAQLRALETRTDAARAVIEQLKSERAQLNERVTRIPELEQSLARAQQRGESLSGLLGQREVELARAQQLLASERNQSQEKLALLDQAKGQLSDQFQALAGQILEQKTQVLGAQSEAHLTQLLHPLREQIGDFKRKVEEVYVNEGKDRSAMGEQLRQLMQLNQSLSREAQHLTQALRGDRKVQGNWGEIVLEELLERAGLVEGRHFERQFSLASETSRQVPDIVLKLPGGRNLVIDAKVSLPDYRAFAAADLDGERKQALKQHLHSIRQHIRGLAERNYQSLYGLNSLDFVLMFVPLEPAFMLAVTHDPELFHTAWDSNVLLVSPSTLLFVVRTVAQLWRQEDLSLNAQEISRRGGELYDKLSGFVQSLDKVGEQLKRAQDSYFEARNRLVSGTGNAIRQAELLRNLGVKPSKPLPPELIARAQQDDAGTGSTEST